jgi:hypothetical protein
MHSFEVRPGPYDPVSAIYLIIIGHIQLIPKYIYGLKLIFFPPAQMDFK